MKKLLFGLMAVVVLCGCGVKVEEKDHLEYALKRTLDNCYDHFNVSAWLFKIETINVEKVKNDSIKYSGLYRVEFFSGEETKVTYYASVKFAESGRVVWAEPLLGSEKLDIDISDLRINDSSVSYQAMLESPFVLDCFVTRNKFNDPTTKSKTNE